MGIQDLEVGSSIAVDTYLFGGSRSYPNVSLSYCYLKIEYSILSGEEQSLSPVGP